MKKEPVLILAAFFFALGAFVLLQPENEITGKVVLDEGTEEPLKTCRTVNVPYEEYQTITVLEEYEGEASEQLPLEFDAFLKTGELYDPPNYGTSAWLTVKNADQESGYFTASITFEGEEPVVREKPKQFLEPGQEFEFYAQHVTGFDTPVTVSYEVKPTFKIVRVMKNLTKPVQKQVAVVKYRKEEVCD